VTLSVEDVGERGLEEETTGVSAKPDEGWDYNVGREGLNSYKPDLSKYPEDLARQYKEPE